jgi:DNA-binding XRE family transcriptional regulator
MDKDKKKALKQAKKNLADYRKRGDAAIGGNLMEFIDKLMTPQEIAASNLRVAMMAEIIKARIERGISQKKLEELSGVKQPIIARMEKGYTSPQIDTVLKILEPLGKTLYIGDLSR